MTQTKPKNVSLDEPSIKDLEYLASLYRLKPSQVIRHILRETALREREALRHQTA
jgi:hypothetical protein